MEKGKLNFLYVSGSIFFLWCAAGMTVLLHFLLFSNSEQIMTVLRESKLPTLLIVVIWAGSPLALIHEVKRYWNESMRKVLPKFLLQLLLLKSYLIYGTFIFSGFILIPVRRGLPLPLVYIKVLAGIFTIPLIISIFLIEKKKAKQQISTEETAEK
jgi:hypothetical protein